MKLSCFSKIALFFLLAVSASAENTAFYYGTDFSGSQPYLYDRIVVQPENLPSEKLAENPEKYYAYLSVCEINLTLPESLKLGENRSWKSQIGDLRKKEYRELILKKAAEIRARGFKNFFLDTLDSYIPLLKEEDKLNYRLGIIDFIKELKAANPKTKIMLNRGFEIMKDARPYVDYMAAESLYYGMDPQKKTYIKMPAEDSLWLKEKLKEAQSLGYQITVIDYLPDEKKAERLELARKIREDGFSPYISNLDLSSWGQNEYEKVKRKVIVFYDSSKVPDKIYSQAHRLVSGPLEYLGYIPKLLDIKSGLPDGSLDAAGIIFVLENNTVENFQALLSWIQARNREGIKTLFLGYIPLPQEEQYLAPLGLKTYPNSAIAGEKNIISVKSSYAGFESPPSFYYSENLMSISSGTPLIEFLNARGQKHVQAAITPWGGYAIEEAWITMAGNYELFTINPYVFFKKALQLPDIPAPDPTTENGRRIMFIHIDGDGFSSPYEQGNSLYAGEILKREILEKYKLPHSVSVIRGELESPAIKPEFSQKLKETARSIFSLKNVEIGNHSYSHPFKWIQLAGADEYSNIEQVYSLSIPGYRFNMNEEIIGTKNWLERELAPQGKKNNIFFWTGDCIAPKAALSILKENGMLNINGGYTAATKQSPYLFRIAPLGIERDGYFQIFTGQQNENVYTELWTGPFWGYRKVIETFELTENPRRTKPLNIYYHFYSASKYSSLQALKYVYDYAIKQKTNPQHASQYARKIEDFYRCELYRYKNEWILASSSDIRTVRLPGGLYPEISGNAAGWESKGDERYVNLWGDGPTRFSLSSERPTLLYLKNSNAKLEYFKSDKNNFSLKLSAPVKIEYELGNIAGCRLRVKDMAGDLNFEKEIYGECR